MRWRRDQRGKCKVSWFSYFSGMYIKESSECRAEESRARLGQCYFPWIRSTSLHYTSPQSVNHPLEQIASQTKHGPSWGPKLSLSQVCKDRLPFTKPLLLRESRLTSGASPNLVDLIERKVPIERKVGAANSFFSFYP